MNTAAEKNEQGESFCGEQKSLCAGICSAPLSDAPEPRAPAIATRSDAPSNEVWISYTNEHLARKVENLPLYLKPDEVMNVGKTFKNWNLPHVPQPFNDHLGNVRHLAHHFIGNSPSEQEFDSFYMVDLGTLILQMSRWRQQLPMVHPFYAVKCNPLPQILEVLSALGAGFDCASQEEFMSILDHNLASTDDIIFANPCKQINQMRKARAMGLKYVTFDNEEELHKLARYWPDAQCVLRIATDDSASVCQFSVKFGCPWSQTRRLLEVASELQLSVVGVSFHVGSGCGNPNVHVLSCQVARNIFDEAKRDFGFHMHLLDIGGGFLASETAAVSFEAIARNLAPYLTEHFADVRIIAEPGRYFGEPVQSLVMNVYSKRVLKTGSVNPTASDLKNNIASCENGENEEEVEVQIYVNDGVYHSFNCVIFDHVEPRVFPLVTESRYSLVNSDAHPPTSIDQESNSEDALDPRASKIMKNSSHPFQLTTMYGPTCDSMDCIFKRKYFPRVEVGDWLVVPNFGAYTSAAATSFNGFSTKRKIFVTSVPYTV